MVNHYYDYDDAKTLCGEYSGDLAWAISSNFRVSCPQCRDLIPTEDRADQWYPFAANEGADQ